jgi:hypothetical protein
MEMDCFPGFHAPETPMDWMYYYALFSWLQCPEQREALFPLHGFNALYTSLWMERDFYTFTCSSVSLRLLGKKRHCFPPSGSMPLRLLWKERHYSLGFNGPQPMQGLYPRRAGIRGDSGKNPRCYKSNIF